MRRAAVRAGSCLGFVAGVAAATAPLSVGARGPTGEPPRAIPILVSASWLAEHQGEPGLSVIHVGDRADYEAGHIPGARLLTLAEVSTPRGEGLSLQLPAVDTLTTLFEGLGISDDGRVVLYFGKDQLTPTTRIFFTLDWLGFGARTALLDGGLPAWRAEGRAVTSDVPPPARGRFTPRPRSDALADRAWIEANLSTPAVAVVDARLPQFYTGDDDGRGRIPRPGHIAGAGSLPYSQLVDEAGRFRQRDAIEALLGLAGVEPSDTVAVYCHIGQQATAVYFVSRMLGRNVRLYDGSYEEWAAAPSLPIETGPPRR